MPLISTLLARRKRSHHIKMKQDQQNFHVYNLMMLQHLDPSHLQFQMKSVTSVLTKLFLHIPRVAVFVL